MTSTYHHSYIAALHHPLLRLLMAFLLASGLRCSQRHIDALILIEHSFPSFCHMTSVKVLIKHRTFLD
jgi:hypothetical protein